MVHRLCTVLPIVDHCQEKYKGQATPFVPSPPGPPVRVVPQHPRGYQLTKAVAISQPLCLCRACRHHHQVAQQLKEGGV